MKQRNVLHTLEDTSALARMIRENAHAGDIIALTGPIGAGKTTFTKALAAEFGISQTVVSPTYTLLQPYTLPHAINGITELIHIDAYRIENPAELSAIGFEELVSDPHAIVVIEWAENIMPLLHGRSVTWMKFEIQGEERVCSIEG